MEYFYQPFKHFHPLRGKVPEYFSNEFEYIAKSARKILKGRTKKQLDYEIKTINWIMEMADRESPDSKLIEEISNELLITNKKPKRKQKTKKTKFINDYYSPASLLLNSIGKYDISERDDFPNAIYSEYFAILALALIEVACIEIDHPIIKPLKNKVEEERNNLKYLSHLAFKSMEAISFANLLSSKKLDELTYKFANKQHHKKISIAATKGHEKRRKIKIKFIKFYKNGQLNKKIKAAKEFVITLSKDERKEFVDTNIENTLLKALREYEKGQFKCNNSDLI